MKKIMFLMMILVFLYGCETSSQNAQDTVKEPKTIANEQKGEMASDAMQKKPETLNEEPIKENSMETSKDTLKETTKKAKELANNYYRFDKAHYEQSLMDGKIIFLDFHADWCPICNQEQPEIISAFNELESDDVVGYQVHYNDGNTNDDDTEMAKKYGISYQHTKVIIDYNGDVALKSLESFDKNKVLEAIKKVEV